MKEYITLLKSNKTLFRLSSIQLISYFGAWFSNVAIYTLLVQMQVSNFLIASVAALHFLPGVLQAPFTGVLIDKLSPKRLMAFLLLIEIISTLLLMTIESGHEIYLLFALVFVRMGASSFYFTVEMSLLPKLLKAQELKLANEIHSIIWSFSYSVGMALSGLVVYALGVKVSFLLDALLFVVALALLLKTSINLEKVKETHSKYAQMFKEGLVYLFSEKKVLHLILLHASVGFTVFDALVTMMAKYHYASFISVPLAIGFINATRAIALIIGPALLSKHMHANSLSYVFMYQGLSILVWAFSYENFYFSLIGTFLTGLSTTVLWSYTYTLIQLNCQERYYGRVVSYNDMMFLLTGSLVSFYIGFATEYLSLGTVLASLGLAFFVFAFYFMWIKKTYQLKF